MNLKQIKEIALANVSDPDYEYIYRMTCRWFSKTFHTPLQDVYNMSPDEVFLHYFETGYEKLQGSDEGEDSIFYDMMKAIDPDFDEKEEEDLQDFIEMIEAEEEAKRQNKANQTPTRTYATGYKEPKTNHDKQSLHGKPQGSFAKPVVKTYKESLPEDADGQDLEGLDALSKSSSEDGGSRSAE